MQLLCNVMTLFKLFVAVFNHFVLGVMTTPKHYSIY